MDASDSAVDSSHSAVPAPRAARRAYALSLLLLAIYAIDVLAGKAAVLTGSRLEWRLGDFGEFLVVLAMSIAFVAGLMLSENTSSVSEAATEE
jgi:hypothetical protein